MDWTSPAPHGLGSTRRVMLKLLSVDERFVAWEPGRRYSFSIDAISLPLVAKMLEDTRLESVEGGSATRMRWRVAYTPNLVSRLLHPLVRHIFGKMFSTSLHQFKRYVESGQAG